MFYFATILERKKKSSNLLYIYINIMGPLKGLTYSWMSNCVVNLRGQWAAWW